MWEQSKDMLLRVEVRVEEAGESTIDTGLYLILE